MTSPQERVVREGWENRVPRTPDEFAQRWKESEERKRLMIEIDEYDQKYSIGGEYLQRFQESRKAQQAKHQRAGSPYTLSYSQQVQLCLWRGFKRLKADPSLTFTQLFGNFIMALIIGSVFFNLQPDTASFYQRGALLFFAVLLNAFGSALEVNISVGSIGTCADTASDSHPLRPTSHRRKAPALCILPSVGRSLREYADRYAIQDRKFHHLQLDAIFHDWSSERTRSVLFLPVDNVRHHLGHVHVIPNHRLRFTYSLASIGACGHSHSRHRHLHRFRYSYEIYARMVSLDQLHRPCRVFF